MKRFIAVMLIALVVVSGAFAAWGAKKGPEMMVGGKTGWGMDMTFTKVANETITAKNHNIPVEAAFIVDLDAPVSLEADLGTNIRIYGGENVDAHSEASMALAFSGAYRYDVDPDLALKAGLGFGYDLLIKHPVENTTVTMHTFSLFADLSAAYDVADNIAVIGGIRFGGDVARTGASKIKVGNNVMDGSYDFDLGTNFSFGLNVGAAYKF